MKTLAAAWCLALAFSGLARAQEAASAAPANYRVELENAFVKVTRASFQPHVKVPVHLHPTHPTVYVYLTDGGPMRFIHITPSYTIERAPVRAGGIRYNRNWHNETHVIEYLGDQPTEYLRVEMKTKPDEEHRDVRRAPEDSNPIEDAQVRVTRHRCAEGAVCDAPAMPTLIVSLPNRSAEWVGAAMPAARTYLPQRRNEIWIELKTAPITK